MKIEKNRAEIIIISVLSVMTWGVVGLVPGAQAADPPAPSPTAEEQKGAGTVEERGIPLLPPSTLPNPVVGFTGKETHQVNGQNFIRYKLRVKNYAEYPDKMFAPAPNLPPCGANTNASRTWVNIYHATKKSYIYGFCALGASTDLVTLWFARPEGQPPPSPVIVVLEDRQANKQYVSNPVTIP